MRILSLVINSLLLVLMVVTFNPWRQLLCSSEVSDSFKQSIRKNQVAITCSKSSIFGQMSYGGQGTIIDSILEGDVVLTAAHVVRGMDDCNVMTSDSQVYILKTSWISDTEDLAEVIIWNHHQNTKAQVSAVYVGDTVYTFGEVEELPIFSGKTLINFMFTFNNEFYCGKVLAKLSAPLLLGYPTPREHMYLSNIFSIPGSSGEGIFNTIGQLVGVVSGGSEASAHATYIVDVKTSLDAKAKRDKEKSNVNH